MKIKNVFGVVCAIATLNLSVNAAEPGDRVEAASSIAISVHDSRSAVRPQGGVGNVKFIETTPVAMPAENSDGWGLFASRILEDGIAGRPVGTGNRINASSLIQSSAPGNCWVLVHIKGENIALADFVVKTRSSDPGDALKSLTAFDIGREYGPHAVLIRGNEKITSGATTQTGEEIWFFARPPLFKGGSETANMQVLDWVNYQNSTFGDFAVTITVALQGKEDFNISWAVLSTKSTASAPFVKLGADGMLTLLNDPDPVPRCYIILAAETLAGPWRPVGNVCNISPTAVLSGNVPQTFFKVKAQ